MLLLCSQLSVSHFAEWKSQDTQLVDKAKQAAASDEMLLLVLFLFDCDDWPDAPAQSHRFLTLKASSHQEWFLMQKTQTAIKYKLTPGLHYKYLHSSSTLGAVRYFA